MLRKVVKIWKDSLKQKYDGFAIKFLNKRFESYKNVVIGRAEDKLKAKADVYRHMIRYAQQVFEYIEELEQELIDNKVEVYFPEDKEKVIVIKDTLFIEDMETHKDWNRAYKQENEL
jgi:hypothetical protein